MPGLAALVQPRLPELHDLRGGGRRGGGAEHCPTGPDPGRPGHTRPDLTQRGADPTPR